MVTDRLISWTLSMTKMKTKGVKQVMLPLTVCGWILGMGVIEFPLGNRWPVISFFYALVHVLGFGFVVKLAIDDLEKMVQYEISSVEWITVKFILYANVWININGTVMSWIRMKKVRKIVHRLECLNQNMEKMGIATDYSVVYLRELIASILHVSYLFIYVLVGFKFTNVKFDSIWRKLAFIVAAYYPDIHSTIGDLSFITLVRYVS